MQPSPDHVIPQTQELLLSYTHFERVIYLKRLFPIAAVLALISFASAIATLIAFINTTYLEYLGLLITNILVLLLSIIDIFWSVKFPNRLQSENPSEDLYYHNLLQDSQTIAYIHSLLSQITLALEVALTFSLFYFETFHQYLWLSALQFFLIIGLVYLVFIGYVQTHNTIGTKRLIIYVCIILTLILASFSAIFLKQIYNLDQSLLFAFKVILLALIVLSLLIAFVNVRRIKPLFAPLSFLYIIALIIAVMITGELIREVQDQQDLQNTKAGCRDTMQTLGEVTLQQMGCHKKYESYKESPFLSCSKDEQTYMWELDVDRAPEDKLNTLACLNMECCQSISRNVLYYPKSLCFLFSCYIALGFVLAANALALSKTIFKIFKIRVYGDFAIILVMGLVIALLAGLVFYYVPVEPQQVQHSFVEVEQITVLPEPSYKHFKKQNAVEVDYNIENCQLATTFLLEPISVEGDGVRIAMAGTNGEFIVINDVNSAEIWIMTGREGVEQVFGKQDGKMKVDYVIFQGTASLVEYFLDTVLYFCTNSPLNANFKIIQQEVDLDYLKQKNRSLVAVVDQQDDQTLGGEQQEQQPQPQLNPYGNQQLNNLKFYSISGRLVDVEDSGEQISAADISIYFGGYMLASCQEISYLEASILHTQSDPAGKFHFNNLSEGYMYTIVTKAKDYKYGCSVVDLTQNAISSIQLNYKIPMTKDFGQHSMRLIMHWLGPVDYDLYGIFSDQTNQCVTGALSKECGGMSYKQTEKNLRYLTVHTIQPFKYLFFVTRNLMHEEALDKIKEKGSTQINQDELNSKLKVLVYVSELEYPLIEYPMPVFTKNEFNEIDFNWLVFCVKGAEGDTPRTVQKYWHDMGEEEVSNSSAYKKATWPTTKECGRKHSE